MRPSKPKTPQDQVSDFWSRFVTKTPGKVTSVFPAGLYATLLPRAQAVSVTGAAATAAAPDNSVSQTNFGAGYEAAAAECRARVSWIVRDCIRTNTKFTDGDFDLRGNGWDCMVGLCWSPPTIRADTSGVEIALGTLQENRVLGEESALSMDISVLRRVLAGKPVDDDVAEESDDFSPDPRSVHRVDWVYEDPHFEIDGFSSSDMMQGANSADCWWLSAVATICHRRELMDKVCVARDEACGVYGFVFYRDGVWVPTVADDNLFLAAPDFGAAVGTDLHYPTGGAMRRYRKANWTEKVYAKAHGDYGAIWGGRVGEGVEDMTGGVNSDMVLEDVLSKDALWTELLNQRGNFVFGLDIQDQSGVNAKNGLANAHAYWLLQAREEVGEDGKKVRLVKVRNPWGEHGSDGMGEWNGPWSDGSKELHTGLDYRFENDGIFWMTYADMLGTVTNLYRTRLFDDTWTVTQEWTGVNVARLSGYIQK